VRRVALGVVAGLVLIHLGGLAQLAILTGTCPPPRGSAPAVPAGDLIKIAVLVPVWRSSLRRFARALMARVSFAGVKRAGIALGWAVLFIAIGVGITIGLRGRPGLGGREWLSRRPALRGHRLRLMTWIVGRY